MLVYLRTFPRYLSASYRGTYDRAHLLRTTFILILAIVYTISPVDLIPDFLVGIGVVDDMGVLAIFLKLLKGELDRFLDWEADTVAQDKAVDV